MSQGFKCLFLDPLNCSSGRFFKAQLNGQAYLALEVVKTEANLELLTEEVEVEFGMTDCAVLRNISQWIPDVSIDYILYNYIEGETLAQLLKKQQLPEQNVLAWICDLLNALSNIHSKALLGRSFSSESIKVTKNSRKLVLFDLGFFPQLFKPSRRAVAAPELVLWQEYDPKLDVWLLGTIAYEMLTRTVSPMTIHLLSSPSR